MDVTSGQQISLQTLVSVVQNAVQAQNLIATNISKLTAALSAAFPTYLTSSTSWTPGTITNGSSASKAITVSGAVFGNYTLASLSESLSGCSLTAYVSAADTVTAVIANNTGGSVTLGAATLKTKVMAV